MASLRELLYGPACAIRRAFQWQQSALTNVRKAPPIFLVTNNMPTGLKIHVGSGEINLQGWINVDARPFDHVHARTSSLELAEFTDGAVGAIYMCHVLEHLSFAESAALLATFRKKLAPGGALLLSVPDFDALVKIYTASNNDLESIKNALMGGQGYEYNFHKSVYNRAALATLLEQSGFRDVTAWTTNEEFGTDIGDWSSARAKLPTGESVGLSLNLKARTSSDRG